MENWPTWEPSSVTLGKEIQFSSKLSLESAIDSLTNNNMEDEGFWSPRKLAVSTDESTFFTDEDSPNAVSFFDTERDIGCWALMERTARAAVKARTRKSQPAQRLRKAQSDPVLSRPVVTSNYKREESVWERSCIGQENPLERGGLLADISERIGTSWKKLGSKLGLKAHILDSIKDENGKNEERAFEVLTQWSRREGNLPDMGKLSCSLESIGRKDVAEILEQSTSCCKHCNSEEQLNLCVKKTRSTNQTEDMICEDKETGRFFLVKQIPRSSFCDGNFQAVDRELEDLHQRFTTTKLCQEHGYSTSTNRDSLYPIQESDYEGLDVPIQLATCEKLNDTLDNIYNKLVTLVGETWNDANSQVRKAVYEFAGELNSEYDELLQTLQELSSKPLLPENEKRLHFLQEMHGKWAKKREQLGGLFSSVFFQEAEMRPRSCAATPQDKMTAIKFTKRKRTQNELMEGRRDGFQVVQEISLPFMVQRSVPLPCRKRSK